MGRSNLYNERFNLIFVSIKNKRNEMVNKSKSKGSNKTGGGGKGQKTQKVKKKSQQKGHVKEDTTTATNPTTNTIEIIEPKNVLTEVQQNGEINGNSIQVYKLFCLG